MEAIRFLDLVQTLHPIPTRTRTWEAPFALVLDFIQRHRSEDETEEFSVSEELNKKTTQLLQSLAKEQSEEAEGVGGQALSHIAFARNGISNGSNAHQGVRDSVCLLKPYEMEGYLSKQSSGIMGIKSWTRQFFKLLGVS